ncbi:unnamed protein product [Eruca vesicaria subsp. sativa]|uniref:Uncharacterized protein n=1 Tax=Eruca vesicaria subsp. sativa TaxID=29727 RepID=A0ABC8LMG6_ERUVS|nr:unnamed protein product [Eruca vesicaria subsp. sativa]
MLLVDCSSCRTPLHLPPGATRIRCALCHAFTLVAPEPHHQSHAPSSHLPFSNSFNVPPPSTSFYPPPVPSHSVYPPPTPSTLSHSLSAPPAFSHVPSAPSPYSHAPRAPSPFSHAPSAPSSFNHGHFEPSPYNHAPPGPPPPVHGQKRAVIVGVTYKDTKSELKGCINDAKCMKFMLMKRYNFPESSILMLTGIDYSIFFTSFMFS